MLSRIECEKGADVLRALAHPLRLGIMQELSLGEKSISELIARLECSQSMMSQQLKLLESQELIACRKEGTQKFCSIKNTDFLKLFSCLKSHLQQCFKL